MAMGVPEERAVVDQFHHDVRAAVRMLAFQFGRSAFVQGCCNSGKTHVLRRELENFQLDYHYTKPGINGRSTSDEIKGIMDAFLHSSILVIDFEDMRLIDPQVTFVLEQVITAGAYVMVVADQSFTNAGTLISQISNHTHLQGVVNRCVYQVNHSTVIQNWLQAQPK